MSARETILNRVRSACGRDTGSAVSVKSINRGELLKTFPSDVQHRLNNPTPLTKPLIPSALTEALITQMESVQMSVVRLQSSNDVAAAVDWYLQEHQIDGDVTVSPSLKHLDWHSKVRFGAANGAESVGVSSAMAAVAETGSIALGSGAQTPATLNFLPENHIVVLYESQIVEHLEDVWTQLRSADNLPRSINLVTGPSRTGDIEITIELGAHGPRRMHVLLVAGQPD